MLYLSGFCNHSERGHFVELILDALLDALKDGLMSIPILYVAYLLMELLERSEKLNESKILNTSRKTGPLLGSLLGIVPQCGISGAAASLFSTGSITAGTMLAVFFATSDEMLPVFLASLADASTSITAPKIALIVISKAACAVVLGYLADLILRRVTSRYRDIHSFCEREGCECEEEEGNPFLSALRHTLKIAVMLIGVGFALNLLFELVGTEIISRLFVRLPIVSELIIGLFGLIPNCSVSVILTQFYLEGILSIGCLFSGLLANAGIGLLVLVRNNKNPRENAAIIAVLYALSAVTGILITLGQSLLA